MKVELDDITKKPTYKRIKEYVKVNFGLNVHTKYIAEVNRKHGLEMHVVLIK